MASIPYFLGRTILTLFYCNNKIRTLKADYYKRTSQSNLKHTMTHFDAIEFLLLDIDFFYLLFITDTFPQYRLLPMASQSISTPLRRL
jgi:hypothetical protein